MPIARPRPLRKMQWLFEIALRIPLPHWMPMSQTPLESILAAPFCCLLVPVLVVLLWALSIYNALVRLRNHVRESWSGIDTELKRRHDLIPNLVAVVKGYAAHEASVFESVTRARAAAAAQAQTTTPGAAPQGAQVAERLRSEQELVSSMRSLFVVSEAYPQLRASQQFLALQRQLAETEDRIQAARRFYNANVRDLNNRVEQFPSNVIAGMGGFQPATFFELESALERNAPAVGFGPGGPPQQQPPTAPPPLPR